MRYNEAKQREEEKKAIDLDLFIRAYQVKSQPGMDKAIGRFAELGMGEGTADRIKAEMLKKGMTVSEREFYNLPRKGKVRQFDVMELAR